MALYSTETRRGAQEIMSQAATFFGPEGLGMRMEEQGDCCVHFTGGGGHVRVTVLAAEGKRTVELETREWDYQVRKFMETLR